MSSTLRAFLIALVLVNLAFVNATEAASFTWLLPMYVLTLASPLLVRWREKFLYRAAWNLAVLALFALLVQHATSSARMAYLLEDGLRLAAICQVHLLNNLGRRQRPDLLFFNSFLIALVTAFLTWDVVYSAIFLVYVPVLVIGMTIHCVAPPGSAKLPADVLRAVVGDGLRRAAVVLGCTGLLFLTLPRDFQRKGLLGDRFDLSGDAGSMELGFAEDVKIEREGSLEVSDAEVMRVALESGERMAVPTHFRGATFLHFDNAQWTTGPLGAEDRHWRVERAGVWTRPGKSQGAVIRARFADRASKRLFVPLSVRRMELAGVTEPTRATPLKDGTVQFAWDGIPATAEIGYRAVLHMDDRSLGGNRRAPRTATERQLVNVPHGSVPALLTRKARELGAELPEGTEQHDIVRHYAAHLSSEYDYLPPGDDEAARSLEAFLMGDGGGHCEIFATTLALMLRTRRIPCRLVTGYLSDEWDEETNELVIRRLHAHAWVEVLDPKGGWYTVDPTPALAVMQGGGGPAWTTVVNRWVTGVWNDVVGFDAESRAAAAEWLAALPGRLAVALRNRPKTVALLIVCLGAWLWIRHARRPREPESVRAYRRAVARTRISPHPGETPREFLARARNAAVPAPRLAALETATVAHERARFAGG